MAATAIDYHSAWSQRVFATGARVSEVRFKPNHYCPMHWHKRPSLGIVLRGEISKKFEDSAVVIHSNDGFTLPSELLHSDRFEPGSRTVIIELEPDHPLSVQRLDVCGRLFERWHKIKDEQLRWLGQRLARELHRPDEAASLAIDGLVGEVLSVATRATVEQAEASIPDWLMEARDIARNQINRRVSISEIADQVGVHPAYLARRFRAEFGVTPGTFARNARLDWAARELVEGDLPIAELAIQAGFSDQSHFTRAFRLYLDQTPAQYRERYRLLDEIAR